MALLGATKELQENSTQQIASCPAHVLLQMRSSGSTEGLGLHWGWDALQEVLAPRLILEWHHSQPHSRAQICLLLCHKPKPWGRMRTGT